MQKLQIRSVFVFGIWMCVTIVGLMGVAFGGKAKDTQGPKSLNYQHIQQTSNKLVYNHAQLRHINGQPVLNQQTTTTDGISAGLNLLDYTAMKVHLSQAVRTSRRDIPPVDEISIVPSGDIVLSSLLSQQKDGKAVIHILIDPKRRMLDVQSRWGVRTAWRTRSSVVELIHSALVKEDTATIIT